MRTVKSMLQRSQVRLKALLDREYRDGIRWRETGMLSTPGELAALQLTRLDELLRHFRGVEPIQRLRQFPDLELTEMGQLRALPVLDRQGLRELFPRLEELYSGRRDVASYITSGATSEPARFFHSRLLVRRAGGCNLGMYQVLGWRPGMPRFCLWGNLRDLGIAVPPPRDIKGRLLGWLQHTRRFGGFAPDAAEYLRFVTAVREHPGCAVYGYATLLEDCARLMIEWGEELPPGHLATVWTCAELLPPQSRELISQAFGLSTREHYGSRECSTIAAECHAGNRHISPRYIAEVIDPDSGETCRPGCVGNLAFTDLFNDVTPFIRYQIGDLGAVEWRECACGARGPCLTKIAGRSTTMIGLPSGRSISSHVIAYIMRGIHRIERFQVSRLGPRNFECKYIGPAVTAENLAAANKSFSDIFEGASLRFVEVNELDRSISGKLIEYRDSTAE